MSQANQGSSDIGCGMGLKPNKTRRSWTSVEEEMLLASLKELVAQGWKADNGFRAGYLLKLEEAMRKAFPGTDLKGTPHINSKISSWKKNYNSLSLMLDVTGVGFNAKGSFMVDCDNEQWALIVKKDPNACLMRFKSWPFLEDWKEVFGKDRATGANAEDIMEAMYKMYQADGLSAGGDNVDSGGVAGSNHHSNQEGTATDDAVDNICQGDKKVKPARKSSKKRKANEEMDGVYKMLGEMCRDTGLRIDNLATRAGYDFDLGMARQTVFKQLGNIAGLTTSEKFDICEMLADKAQRLEIFIGLPDEAKAEYVERLLQSRNNQDRFP